MAKPNFSFHAFLCTSLDGYIAREDGTVSFANDAIDGKQRVEGEDYGLTTFMSSLDAIVMGRTTYEQVLGFKRAGMGWQYGDIPIFVLSDALKVLPDDSPASVQLLKPEPASDPTAAGLTCVVEALQKHFGQTNNKAREVYVDGGQVVRQFIQCKVLDEITITVIPILIGCGIKLFGPLTEDVKLDFVAVQHWDVGYVQMKYKFRYSSDHLETKG